SQARLHTALTVLKRSLPPVACPLHPLPSADDRFPKGQTHREVGTQSHGSGIRLTAGLSKEGRGSSAKGDSDAKGLCCPCARCKSHRLWCFHVLGSRYAAGRQR